MRQQQLSEQYHFKCSCSACSRGPCSDTDAHLVGLRCPACAGPVVPSLACDAGVCSLQALPAQLPGAGRCFQCVPTRDVAWLAQAEGPNGAPSDVPEISDDWNTRGPVCSSNVETQCPQLCHDMQVRSRHGISRADCSACSYQEGQRGI